MKALLKYTNNEQINDKKEKNPMKLTKKKILVLTLAVCLIAIVSMSTLAWFTAKDEITNNFYIANSGDPTDPDDIFSVDVWENGPDGRVDEGGITYPAVLPGDKLVKEANVENTGSYDQYVRVTVVLSDASIWQEIFEETYVPLQEIVNNLNTNLLPWSTVYDQGNDTLTYVMYYQQIVKVGDVVTVFDEVKIPEKLTREHAAKMAGGFVAQVVADAVQTKNVGADAVEAFETVGMAVRAGNYSILKDTTVTVTNASSIVYEDTIMENVTINSTQAGFQNMGAEVYLNDVTMNAGGNADYANILNGGTTVYNNVDITANGGGLGVVDGAQATFNEGSVNVVATTTNPRYNFYVVGAGSELVINDGEFDFTSKTLKRAYIYADAGTTVTINGGTFGTASTRSGYTAGILGSGTVTIKGGTFGFNPTAWVADGYVAVEANGVWTVSAQ